ncbi:MAG: DUF983 domain-containing protein [Flavobacteriales bacterium]|nr:DUF983 domain-containing protein [Flavobacteriales bacterium]
MLKKGSKLYSIFKLKCPHCHEGPFFEKSLLSWKAMGKVNSKCPNCGNSNNKEPGFYYGAMYVSYGLGIALFVTIWAAFTIFSPNYSWVSLLVTLVLIQLLSFPVIYGLSKIIWANFFIRYKK